MTPQPLPPDQRLVLHRLTRGGELWLHGFSRAGAAILHDGGAVAHVERADLDALWQAGLIQPARTVGKSTVYEITALGREQVQEAG